MKFAILGIGTVGKGILQIYRDERKYLESLCGGQLELVAILDRSWQKKSALLGNIPAFTNFSELLQKTNPDVIIEVTGDQKQAYKWLLEALQKGRHVITANKALLAKSGNELFALAHKNNCHLFFEAAVGGALPIIKTYLHAFQGDTVNSLIGILNSTSNFILSQMMEGNSFVEALQKAQQNGYAEADPSSDIAGYDAAQKLALLCGIFFHKKITLEHVPIDRIDTINKHDLLLIDKLGYVMRPLIYAAKKDDRLYAGVQNTLIPKGHIFEHVHTSLNVVSLFSKYAGQTIIIGEGAGSLPTASAIINDLLYLYKTRMLVTTNLFQKDIKFSGDMPSKFYLHLSLTDSVAVKKVIDIIKTQNELTIDKICTDIVQNKNEIIIITKINNQKKIHDWLEQNKIKRLLSKNSEPSLFRILTNE